MPSPVPIAARRAWAIVLAAVLAVLTLPAAAHAAAGWTASQALPQSLTDGAVLSFVPPEVEVDRAGNAHALWVESPFASPVMKVATKPAGGQWSAPTTISATHADAPVVGRLASLTVGPDGTATVAWQDSAISGSTGIWASTRAPGGSWGAAVNVSATADTPTQFGSAGPRAVTDREGNTTVVWQAGLDMRAATRPAGGSWGAPVDVYNGVAEETNNLYGLAVDVANDGAVTVAFRVGKTSDFGIYAKTRATVGGPWSAIQEIAGRGNGISADFALAVSGAGSSTGEATAAWLDGASMVKTSTRTTGTTWSTPADAAAGAASPKLAYDRHGNAVAVWQTTAGIATMRRTAGTWSTPAELPGAEAGSAPQLGATPGATAHVAWLASDGTAPIVKASRYAGGAWSAVDDVSDAGVTATAPALAVGPTGDVDVIWAADAMRGATYRDEPELGVYWTANGLPGSFDLRSWIRYLGGNAGVELSEGAARPDVNDQNSFRLGHSDAWRVIETGETVVEGDGQVRFSYPVHFIDNRIVDPQFRIAADGLSGRVVADGQGSGSMEEAMNGNWQVEPYQGVHLLDLDVAAGTKVVSSDGERTTWVGVPAYIATAGAPYLSYEAGTRYGFVTITAPTSLPSRSEPVAPGPGPGGGPGPVPGPGPKVDPPKPVKPKPVAGTVTKTGPRGAVTVKLAKAPGVKAGKKYRVKVTRKGKTVATGTVRGRTLKLSVRKTGKGKRARYPKLKGAYTLSGAKGVKGVTKTQLTIGKPA